MLVLLALMTLKIIRKTVIIIIHWQCKENDNGHDGDDDFPDDMVNDDVYEVNDYVNLSHRFL